MKISFSTLGCPNFSWPEIYSMAKDLGFDGIEIRGLGDDIFAVKAAPFRDESIEQTVAHLKSLHLEIPCLSSGNCLKYIDQAEKNKKEIQEYINLAKKTGTPYIRILGDLDVKPENDVIDDKIIINQLKELAPIAKASGVTLLVETNGVYADTARLANVLNSVKSDNVAALW
ncbi:MAG: TIM barrel protein, partial [Clostridia bacterium]